MKEDVFGRPLLLPVAEMVGPEVLGGDGQVEVGQVLDGGGGGGGVRGSERDVGRGRVGLRLCGGGGQRRPHHEPGPVPRRRKAAACAKARKKIAINWFKRIQFRLFSLLVCTTATVQFS